MPLSESGWTRPVDAPDRLVNWNIARGLRVTVIDGSVGRRVEIATLLARPLRDQETAALRRCLAGN